MAGGVHWGGRDGLSGGYGMGGGGCGLGGEDVM